MRFLQPLLATLLTALLAQPPTAEQMRDRLDAYLLAYQPELSALVATEAMTQSISARTNGDGSLLVERSKALRSEVAFVGLPGDGGLMGFRRVMAVDGKPVEAPGASLAEMLQSLDPSVVARRLLDQSARHNIGQPRTTNMPSLSLELLQPRHRQRFAHRLDGRGRVGGTNAWILIADETHLPSIVRGNAGQDAFSLVRAWVDEQGRLLRTEVRLRNGRMPREFEPAIRVDFARHDTLGLLVPVAMRETFWTSSRHEGSSVAKYSDYRRFQTSGRIVPPPR